MPILSIILKYHHTAYPNRLNYLKRTDQGEQINHLKLKSKNRGCT